MTGDADRLHQVLANLLTNARTHTPPGTTVTAVVRDGPLAVEVLVRDDGPGIPRDRQLNLFDRFSRGDTSRSRAHGSTGLGLAIAHSIAVAHGGTLTVDSTPKGSCFRLRLPAAAGVFATAPAQSARNPRPPEKPRRAGKRSQRRPLPDGIRSAIDERPVRKCPFRSATSPKCGPCSSSVADGPCRSSTTRPTTFTRAPTRSCSAGRTVDINARHDTRRLRQHASGSRTLNHAYAATRAQDDIPVCWCHRSTVLEQPHSCRPIVASVSPCREETQLVSARSRGMGRLVPGSDVGREF